MPSNLFNFSRYFKKPSSTNQDDPSMDQPVSDQGAQSTQSVVVSSAPYPPSTIAPTAYSGIGNPPGGVAYNGIGTPPSPKAAPLASVSSTIDMGKRVGMDVLSRLTQRANSALMLSVDKVKELKQELIDTEHILWGLLHDNSIYQLISDCKATPADLQKEIEQNFKPGNFSGQPHFSPRVKRVLEMSLSAARSLGYEFISPEHILLALSSEGEGLAARILTKYNLKTEVLNQKITGKKELEKDEEKKKGSAMDQYTEDLTAKAAKGDLDPVVGRSMEIERVLHIISRRTKNNPVLIGDAGVGKTAIVEGLAQRIAHKDVPETLLNKRILLLDLMSLIAGARHRGEFEERLKNLIKEVKAASGSVILFIDEIHNMVGAGSGSEGTMDASNILKPSLARGELQMIGTTTVTEYRKNIEKDPALERRFQPILVAEPTAEVAIEMVTALRDKYEAFHRVKISDEAIEAAVRLSQKYIADRFLPDKAVDLIDEAAAAVRLPAISLPEDIKSGEEKLKRLENEKKEAEKSGDNIHQDTINKEIEDLNLSLVGLKEQYQMKKSTSTSSVTPEIIAEIVSRWTNIPVSKLTEKESSKLLNMEDIIHERLINQDEAVAAVAEAVRRGRAGLKSGKRPIGSFIFLGPTGVGKTELAKTLAEVLFGSDEMIVRLDMSEYMEKHEVAKLIGAPPGYVGYEEGGQLTEAVRRRPYSVVLLDEIEKANPDVFNILIQLLDDGRLTDNKGRTISFKNTIVICTSNLGSSIIQEEILKENPEISQSSQMADSRQTKEEDKQKDAPVSKQNLPRFTTYVVSPTGREIITLGPDYWEKEAEGAGWKKGRLSEYFAGSTIIDNTLPVSETDFPITGFDSHLIAADGSETITWQDNIWFRTSTTNKEWTKNKIVALVEGQTVVNALPDKPDQQLPAVKIETHAISPTNMEIITLGDRFWKRENLQTKDWITGLLDQYFEESQKSKAPDLVTKVGKSQKSIRQAPDNNKTNIEGKADYPVEKWEVHLFKPTGEEIIIAQDNYWQRKNPLESAWQKGKVIELFPTVKTADEAEEILPLGQKEDSQENKELDKQKDAPVSKQNLPRFTTYVVSPTGREIITLGPNYWGKETESTGWKKGMLSEYFAGSTIIDNKLPASETDFPITGFDSHLIAADGSETITLQDNVWFRTSTTNKEWTKNKIVALVEGQTVVNALPDKPDQQLPAVKIETHAISPTNMEIITLGDRFWKRENLQTKDWTTGLLDQYFEESQKSQPKAGKSQSDKKTNNEGKMDYPVEKWEVHLFKPTGEEIIIAQDNYWQRKNPLESAWQKGKVIELFPTVKTADEAEEILPLGQKEEKKEEKENQYFVRIASLLMEELRKFFRPELLNRFDEVVIFQPLTREHMHKIVELQVKGLEKLLIEQNIRLTMTLKAKLYLSEVGFDPIYGARPLRRTIQRLVENQISSLLIKSEATYGDTIMVDFDGNELSFKVAKMKEQKASQEPKETKTTDASGQNVPAKPKTITYSCASCNFRWQVESISLVPTDCPMCHGINIQALKAEEPVKNTASKIPETDEIKSSQDKQTPAPASSPTENTLESYFTASATSQAPNASSPPTDINTDNSTQPTKTSTAT